MRVLVVPTPDVGVGSISKSLSIVEALSRYSHQVAVACTNTCRRWFAEASVKTFLRPEPVFDAALSKGIIPVHNLADYAQLIGLANPAFIEESIKAEVEAIRAFKPDIVFSHFDLTAPISTRLCNLPLASIAQSPFHPKFSSPLFKVPNQPEKWIEPFNNALCSSGIEPIQAIEELHFMRSEIKISASVPALEPFLIEVPNIRFVGPLLSNSLENHGGCEWITTIDRERPLVFVYLGISDIMPDEIIEVVPEAFDNTEFQVIVSFGNHPNVDSLPNRTPNVRFERFVPGEAILQRSDVFIFHGGQGATVNSIQNEVPSIIFPCLVFERDFNARMAESIGAGVRLDHQDFTPARLRETARQLTKRKFTDQARSVAAALRSMGGAQLVVQILNDYIHGK